MSGSSTFPLSAQCKLAQAITITAGAAGTTAINGSIIDMSGYEGVLFVVQFGAIVAGAATSIKAQRGNAANMSDAADLQGTSQTIADTDDDKVFFIDVYRPGEQYIRLVVSRATQNATVSAMAFLYGAHQFPTSHGTGVAGELHVDEPEGTA